MAIPDWLRDESELPLLCSSEFGNSDPLFGVPNFSVSLEAEPSLKGPAWTGNFRRLRVAPGTEEVMALSTLLTAPMLHRSESSKM